MIRAEQCDSVVQCVSVSVCQQALSAVSECVSAV